MKTFKRFFAVIIAVVVICASLCCTSLAVENAYVIDTDVIYAELPEDYLLDFIGNYFAFSDDYNYLYIEAIKNDLAKKGVANLSAEEAQECFFNIFLLEGDESYRDFYTVKYSKTEKTTVNGLTAYLVEGYYTYTDEETSYTEDYSYPFVSYIMATEENIFMVTYEDYDGDLTEKEDIGKVLSTLAVNGTFFKGDEPTFTHDFSNAISYSEALIMAEEELYGFEDYGEYSEEILDEATIGITKAVLVIIFIVPLIIMTIVSVILIILYVKKKKELNGFEERYGDVENIHNAQMQYVNNVVYPAPIASEPIATQQNQQTESENMAVSENSAAEPVKEEKTEEPTATSEE